MRRPSPRPPQQSVNQSKDHKPVRAKLSRAPTAPAPSAAQPARSRFGGGFFAGLLGAGLLGTLFGAGLFGGLGSLTSILGFLVQIALIGGLIYLAFQLIGRFRRRQDPALAVAGAAPLVQRSTQDFALAGHGATPVKSGLGLGAAAVAGAGAPRAAAEQVQITPDDYATFERKLQDIQTAYGREDVGALWDLATPEMAGYFQEELNDNARKGVINKISDVKLLQGDLSEAWQEGSTDYATVAMRYELKDWKADRTTSRVVEGDPSKREEAVEIWTFRRDRKGPWKLSAIQQTA
jgi:predicted lipid-binding transport protein (Tim44 family)